MDATLTLDPHFVSSIHGMIAGSGAVMLALAAAVLPAADALAAGFAAAAVFWLGVVMRLGSMDPVTPPESPSPNSTSTLRPADRRRADAMAKAA